MLASWGARQRNHRPRDNSVYFRSRLSTIRGGEREIGFSTRPKNTVPRYGEASARSGSRPSATLSRSSVPPAIAVAAGMSSSRARAPSRLTIPRYVYFRESLLIINPFRPRRLQLTPLRDRSARAKSRGPKTVTPLTRHFSLTFNPRHFSLVLQYALFPPRHRLLLCNRVSLTLSLLL